MRTYTIAMNGRDVQQVKASRGAVAAHRYLDRYRDGDLDGATITIRRGAAVKYGYRLVADVPCEPAGSTKRDFISEPLLARSNALVLLHEMRAQHPEYQRIAIRRVEVA